MIGVVPVPPRIEIAPGVFAKSIVRHRRPRDVPGVTSAWDDAYEVFRVDGGVFEGFELDSVASLVQLVGVLSAFDAATHEDVLRSIADEPAAEPTDAAGADPGDEEPREAPQRRVEFRLPAGAGPVRAHRRFVCDAGASRRARIWAAETLGDFLPDTDWSVELLEQTVLRAGELVGEAVADGCVAAVVALGVEDRRIVLTRYDEIDGGDDSG
jgi:hypothetical protein